MTVTITEISSGRQVCQVVAGVLRPDRLLEFAGLKIRNRGNGEIEIDLPGGRLMQLRPTPEPDACAFAMHTDAECPVQLAEQRPPAAARPARATDSGLPATAAPLVRLGPGGDFCQDWP